MKNSQDKIARFYMTEYDCSFETAKNLGSFMVTANDSECIERASIWNKNGKLRVYINLWSQNRFHAIQDGGPIWFDPIYKSLFIERFLPGLCVVDKITRDLKLRYTGAKSREAFRSFLRRCEYEGVIEY